LVYLSWALEFCTTHKVSNILCYFYYTHIRKTRAVIVEIPEKHRQFSCKEEEL